MNQDMEKTYRINWHFSDKYEFTNGWQLLWYGKWNQDEAIKQRTKLYRKLVTALKPQMIADGRKPNKGNVFYYWSSPFYKEIMPLIDDINTKLKADNDETKKYIEIMKKDGTYHLK